MSTGDLLGLLGVTIGGGLALLALAHTLDWHKQYMKQSAKGKKVPPHPLSIRVPKFSTKPNPHSLCTNCFAFNPPKFYLDLSGRKMKW